MDIPSTLCPMCSTTSETVNHVLWIVILLVIFGDLSTCGSVSLLCNNRMGKLFLIILMACKFAMLKRSVFKRLLVVLYGSFGSIVMKWFFSPGRIKSDFLFDIVVAQSHLWATSRSSKPVIVHNSFFWSTLCLVVVLGFSFCIVYCILRFLETFMGLHQKHHRVKTGGAAHVGEGFSRVLVS